MQIAALIDAICTKVPLTIFIPSHFDNIARNRIISRRYDSFRLNFTLILKLKSSLKVKPALKLLPKCISVVTCQTVAPRRKEDSCITLFQINSDEYITLFLEVPSVQKI